MLISAGPVGFIGFDAQVEVGPVSVFARADTFFRTRRSQLIETTQDTANWKLSAATLRLTLGIAWEGF